MGRVFRNVQCANSGVDVVLHPHIYLNTVHNILKLKLDVTMARDCFGSRKNLLGRVSRTPPL